MAITKYAISADAWTAVTSRGQSGIVHIAKPSSTGSLYITHSTTVNRDSIDKPTTELSIESSLPMVKIFEVPYIQFTADSDTDRYYVTADGMAEIIVDVA